MAANSKRQPPSARQISDWRSHHPTKHLQKFQVVIPDRSKCITSMACHQQQPLLAVSSASYDKNIYIVRYTPPVGSNSGVVDRTAGGGGKEIFQLVSSYQNTFPVFGLSWSGDRLLAGCGNNYLQLFQYNQDNGSLSARSQYPHVIHSHSQFPAPPGRFHQSNRVQSVQFQPGDDSNRFIAVENCNLRLWDIGRSEAPVVSCKISDDVSLCANWGTESGSSLVSCAGVDSSLVVLDLRLTGCLDENNASLKSGRSPVVWFRDCAHSGSAVRTAQWSPFVPYWLATGGDDNLVNIWDMRSTRGPMVRIDRNRQSVRSIAWSQTHGDWLTTGSGDCTWRLWSIRSNNIVMTSTIGGAVEDGKQKSRSRLNIGVREKVMESETMAEYLVGAVELAECGQDSFASSVVTVENSLHWCDAHFAVSSTGELACLTLYPEAYSPWVSHKLRKQSKNVAENVITELETQVYRRDFEAAVKNILNWSKTTKNIDRNGDLREMIDLTMQNYTAQCPWQFANDPTSPINSSGPVLTGKTMALKIYADLYKSATDPIDLISNLYYASRIANAAIADQNQINAARSKHSLNSKTVLDRTGSQVGFNADIDHLEEFRRDLDAITRQIPLLFRRTKLTRPPDELLQSQFELLRLRLELVRLTENWQKGYLYLEDKNKELIYMKLYRMLPQIVESAEKAPQLLPVSLTQRLIEIVLCGDRLRGLEFGRKLVEMYERLDRNGSAGADLKFTNVMGICHLLLYPTVFDQSSGMLPGNSDSAPPSNENSYDSLALLGRSAELNVISSSDDAYVRINRPAALESILVNSKIAIPLIKLEHRLYKLIPRLYQIAESDQSTNNEVGYAKMCVDVIEEIGAQRSISASTNMLYLNALLAVKKFEVYFFTASELIMTYANYEFSKSLCLHMEITGMPHYQLFADQICGSKLSNADRLAQLNPAILVALKILLLIPRLFSQSSAQHSESTIQFAMLSLGRLAISVNRQLWKQCLQWVDSAMNRSLGDQKARLIATESVKSLIQSVEGQINNNNNSISSCNGAVSNQESRQTGGVFITEPSREVPADQLLRLDDWGVKQWSLSVQQQLSAEIYYWLTSAKHWIEKNG